MAVHWEWVHMHMIHDRKGSNFISLSSPPKVLRLLKKKPSGHLFCGFDPNQTRRPRWRPRWQHFHSWQFCTHGKLSPSAHDFPLSIHHDFGLTSLPSKQREKKLKRAAALQKHVFHRKKEGWSSNFNATMMHHRFIRLIVHSSAAADGPVWPPCHQAGSHIYIICLHNVGGNATSKNFLKNHAFLL